MTLKQLFAKLTIANQIRNIADGDDDYCICIYIDNLCQYRLDKKSMYFKTYNQAITSIKEDWNYYVVRSFEEKPLKATANRGEFTIENEDVHIQIQVCH